MNALTRHMKLPVRDTGMLFGSAVHP